MVNVYALAAATLALPLAVLAHPGDNVDAIKREMDQRNTQHAHASRALSQCQNSPQALALRERTAARRAAKALELREKRGVTNGWSIKPAQGYSWETFANEYVLHQSPWPIRSET